MVQKVKKEKYQISPKKGTDTSPWPWPNLPKELTSLLSREHSLMENINFGGVTKSWKSEKSTKCSPIGKSLWPQLTEIQQNKNHSHCFHIWFYSGYYWPYGRRSRSWKDPWIYFKGHSHGALVSVGQCPNDIFLWKSYRETYCHLPTWDTRVPFKFAALSTFYSIDLKDHGKPCTIMVLTGASSPAFVFCNTGAKEFVWRKQDCNVTDPFGSETDSSLRVTEISSSRAAPSVISRQFREILVESDGEILLIFLISKRSIQKVDDVEIYRLDIQKLLWVKMESLGDRTLFVEEECCMWINASKLGCRSNCIYFTQQIGGNWWLFDMQAKAISPAPQSSLFGIES
ncbi:hypothetical protein RND71_041539 [Anisodus tanguticus]|uniref:KIB1-4 beta-propeller domain-containing protein n=1 Tax=Anisodus tanguticus TaxID=243964 RepID=A0AAE1QXK7_9SOLA|nr:hypothetical protein RND71_041539 [Anisodus tanguticus]